LDLFDDHERSEAAIADFAGQGAADDFKAFSDRAKRLFDAFEIPMMRTAEPSSLQLTRTVLSQPSLVPAMAPTSTLSKLLQSSFSDPRLRQLFGRYATYVGGAPSRAPAILALIWQAEAAGVWTVEGGIHALVEAIASRAATLGARIQTNAHVARILIGPKGVSGVELEDGQSISCETIIYAGDPRALATGELGPHLRHVARQTKVTPRSLSARVHSFAAQVSGPELAHHNVFFDKDPTAEFDDLLSGYLPNDPSIYLCATDRGMSQPTPDLERFEIITNAPAEPGRFEDTTTWHPKIMQRMARFGISFQPMPTQLSVTTESDFAQMFPASLGALYGQSPHGLTAGLRRPTARTRVPGLYLAGGGCHPGAGVPMATLSAKHAVEAISNDRILAYTLRPMDTPGGTSTASAMTAGAPSRSSPS
jgi:1-hydroxycarotenoid 3,4-desaturase